MAVTDRSARDTTLSPAAAARPTGGGVRDRREETAIAVFATWMLIGLYLDGWAHQADKPESFFTPWHAVLYSGFVAALAWFAVDAFRRGGSIREVVASPTDRLVGIGLALFVAGAVGDGIWHEIFGVEVDIEALLSPTHLLLLIGGFMMVTGPVRSAAADPTEDAPSLRRFLPTVVTLTLATALVSFFTMYLSAFFGVGNYWAVGGGDVRELTEIVGVGSILYTTVLLLVPVLYVLRRWRPPFGTFTILFGAVAFATTGLEAFDRVELALPGLVGGLAADVLAARGVDIRVLCGAVPLAMWTVLYVVAALAGDLEFAAELVAGSVLLASAGGVLVASAVGPEDGDPPSSRALTQS